MTLRCHLKEAEREVARYFLVTPDSHELLVLCPIVGGTFIGTDNTCKSVKEMQTFFAKEHNAEEKRDSCAHRLDRYIEAIQMDEEILHMLRPLFSLPDDAHAALLAAKVQRREQAGKFKAALLRMQADSALDVLSGSYPHHPAAVKTVMSAPPHSLCAMLLCPSSLDSYTRFDHMAAFRLRRSGNNRFSDRLRSALSNAAGSGGAPQDPVAMLEAAVTAQFGTAVFDFPALVDFLATKSEEVRPRRCEPATTTPCRPMTLCCVDLTPLHG